MSTLLGDLAQDAREDCGRRGGHLLDREAFTGAVIPVCTWCGTDLEAEDET